MRLKRDAAMSTMVSSTTGNELTVQEVYRAQGLRLELYLRSTSFG